MESLSKEKNLIVGLLLGMALAVAIPYAQPSELGASEEVTAVEGDSYMYMVTTQVWRGDIEEDWTEDEMRGPSSWGGSERSATGVILLFWACMAYLFYRVQRS